MKWRISLLLVSSIIFISEVHAQGETFSAKRQVNASTIAGRFRHPFAMVLGPDDSLWITERRGYVIKMNRINGGKTELLNIRSQVKFTTSGTTGIKQDGMFGIALHPELFSGKNFVYLAYTYDSSGLRRVKIVRYNYNRAARTLTGEITLVRGIPGSDDHNGGRLIIANFGTHTVPDYKLLYSCGDRGANQFGNSCDSIQSQYLPTSAQIIAGNKSRYNGKILRINLDGSIPSDNPDFGGTGRSHVWTLGHRNPQGIAVERDFNNEPKPKGIIYSSEQGPASNDEINIIESGKNYGWPKVSGKLDNTWYKYYQWSKSATCSSYPGECSTKQTTEGLQESLFPSAQHQNPIFDLYPGTPPGGSGCNWLANPTLAPSSVIVYPFKNKIPGWENSLLISTLKSSAVYRLKLNPSGNGSLSVPDSVVQYFKSSGLNRYRDLVVANDGITFYLLTDSVGGTSGPSSGTDGGVTNRGSVLEFVYTGALLAIDDNSPGNLPATRITTQVYPNPAEDYLNVEISRSISIPVTYRIYDLTGRKMLEGSKLSGKFEINVVALAPGLYTIQLFSGRDIPIYSKKVIIR